MFRRNKHFIPAYIFAVLIFAGSSISTRGLRHFRRMHDLLEIVLSEYSLHFFGFGVFAILLAWGYYKKNSSFLLIKAGLLALVFAVFIEVYQYFLPYRNFSIVDMAIDAAGIALALAVFWFAVVNKRLFGLIRNP